MPTNLLAFHLMDCLKSHIKVFVLEFSRTFSSYCLRQSGIGWKTILKNLMNFRKNLMMN